MFFVSMSPFLHVSQSQSRVSMFPFLHVPHSGSGVAPMSSLSGVELLGLWEFGTGGLMGGGRGK
jgi:hypothetical protein